MKSTTLTFKLDNRFMFRLITFANYKIIANLQQIQNLHKTTTRKTIVCTTTCLEKLQEQMGH